MESQDFRASVTHLTAQGFGLVRSDSGLAYFARGVWPGDRGIFRPSADGEREGAYAFADLITLEEASSERRPRAELCPHMGTGPDDCYGCPWLIADEAAQLRQKEHRIRYSIARQGLKLPEIEPIWPSPQAFGYRRRAQFKTDGERIGYAARHGQGIVPIRQCAVLDETLQAKLDFLKSQLPEPAWTPTPPHLWNFIDVDSQQSLGEFKLNRRRPFQQANAAQNIRMQAWVRERLAALGPEAPLLELFAGSGNFTGEALALGLKKIVAVEVALEAVEALSQVYGERLTAERADLYQSWAAQRLAARFPETETLLVNPPREGLRKLAFLPRHLPRLSHILYISCEPQTLAQDCKRLIEAGFTFRTVQPLDQLPQTPHVEVLVHLERKLSG